MSGDVLVKWDWEITTAEAAISYGGGDAGAMCIHDLAAALRAEREHNTHLANSLDKAIHNLAESGLDIQRMGKRVAELEKQVQDAAWAHEHSVDDLVAHMDKLQTRINELEADAKLGEAVREMLPGYLIAHSRSDDEDVAWYYGFLVQCELCGFGPTPEAALEAVRKGEP